MKIALDDKHYLNSDQYCYWITCDVTYEGKDGNKKTVERRVSGYARNFSDAAESFIENRIRSSEAVKISQLKDEVKNLKKTVSGWKARYGNDI